MAVLQPSTAEIACFVLALLSIMYRAHVAWVIWQQDLTRSPPGRLLVACAKLAADLGILDRLPLR